MMRITEQEIWFFLSGAAIGSIATYFIATYEQRIISKVRHEIDDLGICHELTSDQYRNTRYPTTIVSDSEILELYHWAQHVKKKNASS
jgi:hypothetical protein